MPNYLNWQQSFKGKPSHIGSVFFYIPQHGSRGYHIFDMSGPGITWGYTLEILPLSLQFKQRFINTCISELFDPPGDLNENLDMEF